MAVRYYDDAIIAKLKKWIPENSNLRVLKPEETKRLFEITADDNNDKAFKMPCIALSRNNDIELLSAIKQPKSYDGLKLYQSDNGTLQLNVIPIKVQYQLDIYTKKYDEGDEYLRNFLFKLINNPTIKIEIPYNSGEIKNIDAEAHIEHIANIRILSTVSDTSAITERVFSGQFTRWTIQFELQDAYLFSIPYRKNWRIDGAILEISEDIHSDGEIEPVV